LPRLLLHTHPVAGDQEVAPLRPYYGFCFREN
jgi:hypothetical protein